MHSKRQLILDHSLPLIAFDGWHMDTLRQGAEKAGLKAEYASIAFPQGEKEAISCLINQFDQEMCKKLASLDLANMRIRDRIFTAVKTRLELYAEHKTVIRKTVSYLSQPQHASDAVKMLWKTVDHMWQASGDTSTDFNYYTKRTLLAGVYSSTLLYWLADESKNHSQSWNFLQHRIDNVMLINKAKAAIKEKCVSIQKLFNE